MKLLISVGILIFSIYPTLAKIQLLDSGLIKPDSPDVLKNIQSTPSKLKKILDDGQSGEFFKEAGMELDYMRKLSVENKSPSEETRKNVAWIFYFIANTPLVAIDSAEQARCAINSRHVDLYLKEKALAMLAISTYRDLFPKGNASRELMASYGAAIMRSFLNGTKSKSYSDKPVFVSEEEKTSMLKRDIEIMKNAFSEIDQIQRKGTGPETDKKINDLYQDMNKRIHDNGRQFQDHTVVVNTKTSRKLLLKNILERSEKNFMVLLTDLFPREKSEIEKYIKMAGYSDQEIRKFIDRTLEKD
ncbi:hypothetical protein [Akkermansia sp.]|uniref:hypothetical protein n=1 Tax=Akkermansia sp. TaxID=1872421 RepID=UPI0025C61C98|nr:hypothetical protein [Akkermansia sp.]MCC8149062.1 hypothetical protein [Akkermansia sp.]